MLTPNPLLGQFSGKQAHLKRREQALISRHGPLNLEWTACARELVSVMSTAKSYHVPPRPAESTDLRIVLACRPSSSNSQQTATLRLRQSDMARQVATPNSPRKPRDVGHPLYERAQKGLFAEALGDAEAYQRGENAPWSWVMIAYVSGRSGDQAKARLALKRREQPERNSPLDTLAFAVAYIGMGEDDRALVELEKAYRHRPVASRP
jgi:hypothetical protein